MSDCLCPLKKAARDAPHLIALRTGEKTFTYSELDALADRTEITSPLIATPTCIPQLFAAIRQNRPLTLLPPRSLSTISSPTHYLSIFTSGSTATPKLAHLSLENLLANARGILPTIDLQPGDAWLLSLPLHHVGGLGIVFRCILARAQIVLDPAYPHITHLSYVPTHLYRAWPTYKTLKAILLGGAPITETPSQLPIIPTYGLTEMGSAVLATKNYRWIDNRLYLGHPLPQREVRLIDGEIYVRGPCLFQGYDTLALPTDWFATGDLALYDPTYGYSILGRKDNLFISGGENIQPEEIEKQLVEHPSIQEAIVVPKPDPEFGTRPVAFIRTTDPALDLPALRSYLSTRLPKYKIPIALHSLESVGPAGLKISRKKLIHLLN